MEEPKEVLFQVVPIEGKGIGDLESLLQNPSKEEHWSWKKFPKYIIRKSTIC